MTFYAWAEEQQLIGWQLSRALIGWCGAREWKEPQQILDADWLGVLGGGMLMTWPSNELALSQIVSEPRLQVSKSQK